MVYPILLKRILHKIRLAYEDILLNKSISRDYPECEAWLEEYFNLSDEDKKSIIVRFERAQTAGIVYAMRRKDREIFLNQFGCFYIKTTTVDFYNALDKFIGDRAKGEYDYEIVKKSALEETRALYIKRSEQKTNARNKNFYTEIPSKT